MDKWIYITCAHSWDIYIRTWIFNIFGGITFSLDFSFTIHGKKCILKWSKGIEGIMIFFKIFYWISTWRIVISENEKKYWVRGQNNYNVFPMNTLDELHFVLSLEWSFNTGLTACTSKQIGDFIL